MDAALSAIPHAPPMRAVREVLLHEGDHTRVRVRVEDDHPLIVHGRLPAVAGVELLAQAAAVHAALRGGGGAGVLLRARGVELAVDELPVGVDLVADVVRSDGTDGPTAAFTVALWAGEEKLVWGSLLVRAVG